MNSVPGDFQFACLILEQLLILKKLNQPLQTTKVFVTFFAFKFFVGNLPLTGVFCSFVIQYSSRQLHSTVNQA